MYFTESRFNGGVYQKTALKKKALSAQIVFLKFSATMTENFDGTAEKL